MAGKLTDELQSLVQRSGTNVGRMRTEAERAAFASSVRKDIAAIVYQLNTVHRELVSVLSSDQDLNALEYGLSGNVIYTHVNASAADAEAYWSDDQARARTVKETVDVLLSEIARLENEIQQALDADAYDDIELRALIQGNGVDIAQLAYDAMGANYVLDSDGLPNMSYSVSQAVDAIGAFFAGFPGTGNTYSGSYPALSLIVRLSDLIVDTTFAQTVVADLTTDLTAIRTFAGMDASDDSTPDYSAYGGPLITVADGDSLEEAIWKLDQVGDSTLQEVYDAGGVGVAGDIQLEISSGEVRLLDDTSTPLQTLFRWVNGASVEIGNLSNTGVTLAGDGYYRLASNSVDPPALGGEGIYNARPDATSAKIEAHYRNSDVSDSNAQLTRDGRVKELEVGNSTIRAQEFVKLGAAAGPSLDTYELTDYAVQLLAYDHSTQEDAYTTIPIPQDEDGNRPSRVQLVAYLQLGQAGAYVGGSGVAFSVQVSSGTSNPGTIGNKVRPDLGYDNPLTETETGLSVGNMNHIVVLEYPEITLIVNDLGLLNIKFSRDVAHADDTWQDDVGLVALHAIWYR